MVAVVAGVGLGLELLGLLVALWGYRRTWRDLGTDEGFIEPIRASLSKAGASVLRRFRRRQVISGRVHATAPALVAKAHGYVHPRRLPDAEADLKAFAAAVQHQLDVLVKRTHETEVRLTERLDTVRAEVTALERHLDDRINQGERITASRTVRGLREQVAGWAFIAIGLVMQSPTIF